SESWVVLEKAQWAKLLPPGDSGGVRLDASWELDREVMAKVMAHFYPPTENTDLAKNRIDRQSLRARVERIEKGVVRARLEGQLRMKHPFYHKDDKNFVEAGLVGYLEFDADRRGIRSLQLVTDGARYGGDVMQPFGAAARAVPPAK